MKQKLTSRREFSKNLVVAAGSAIAYLEFTTLDADAAACSGSLEKKGHSMADEPTDTSGATLPTGTYTVNGNQITAYKCGGQAARVKGRVAFTNNETNDVPVEVLVKASGANNEGETTHTMSACYVYNQQPMPDDDDVDDFIDFTPQALAQYTFEIKWRRGTQAWSNVLTTKSFWLHPTQ